jgi:hypothetical protein
VDGLATCHHEPRRRAGGKAFWKDRAYMFGDEFRQYIESDLMKRQSHPDAKPMGAFSIGGVPDKSEAGKSIARPL